MKGYKLVKNIKNIDDVSTSGKESFDITKFTNGEEKYLFNVKKGLLKNKYSTKLVADTSDTDMGVSEDDTDTDTSDNTDNDKLALNSDDGIDSTNDTTNDTTVNGDVIINGDSTTTDDTTTSDDGSIDDDFSTFTDASTNAMSSNMDLSLNINLPYKAISSNATSSNNDGKNLIWKLNLTDTIDAEFAFELYNWTNIYIIGGSLILMIIILLIIIVMGKNRGHKDRGVKTPVGPINNNSNSDVPSMDMGLNSMGMDSVSMGANSNINGMNMNSMGNVNAINSTSNMGNMSTMSNNDMKIVANKITNIVIRNMKIPTFKTK